jgi:hypothetical protein
VASIFMDGATVLGSPIIVPQVSFDWRTMPGRIIEQDPLCQASG